MPQRSARVARRKDGWKDIQSKARIKKRTKLALLILALVGSLIVISWLVHLTKNLFSPWKLSTNSQRNYIWNGEFNINLLIRTNSVSLFSYNPKDRKVIIVNIPDETYLEVPSGFGKWQLRAIYDLGGDQLLKKTLVEFFAIPIDGFLDFGGSFKTKSASELLDSLKKNPFTGLTLLSNVQTDLTLWELMRLQAGISSVRFDKIRELNLSKLNVLDKDNLLDGTEVYIFDPVKLDSVLSDLVDPAISLEHKTIAVLNATDRPQLAQKAARLITNLGGNVIITSNAQKTLPKSRLIGEQSKTLQRLQQIFDLDDKISTKDEGLESFRAQINLLLGEDYSN